jgi:hypothetical protein
MRWWAAGDVRPIVGHRFELDKSTNVPEGEYSMRPSEGVRNSKRAFSARIVGALSLAQDATKTAASAGSSHFATPPAGMK